MRGFAAEHARSHLALGILNDNAPLRALDKDDHGNSRQDDHGKHNDKQRAHIACPALFEDLHERGR